MDLGQREPVLKSDLREVTLPGVIHKTPDPNDRPRMSRNLRQGAGQAPPNQRERIRECSDMNERLIDSSNRALRLSSD